MFHNFIIVNAEMIQDNFVKIDFIVCNLNNFVMDLFLYFMNLINFEVHKMI